MCFNLFVGENGVGKINVLEVLLLFVFGWGLCCVSLVDMVV